MESTQQILLIEDNPDDQILINARLSNTEFRSWPIVEVSCLGDALDLLQTINPSLILLDLSLPDSTGIDSFNTLYRESQSTSIIVMTGLSDITLAKKLLKLGAQDYLVKGEFDTAALEKSLSYALERQLLKSENDKAQERLIESVLKAQDEERTRIAKELHDGIVQTLTAVSLNLSLMRKELKEFPEKAASHFQVSTENLNNTIEELRDLSHSLMPKTISERRLEDTLRGLLRDLDQVTDMKLEFISTLKEEVNEALKMAIYRIVQELINNAIKHSQASHLLIQLLEYPDSLTLMVEDDGRGFDLATTMQEKNCFGLSSMRSRANALGGRFEMDTKPKQGTNVLISFPRSTD